MKKLTKSIIKLHIKPRENNTHKGHYGHALLVAGHIGFIGAAVITSKACLRAGVGLLTVQVPKDERFILQVAVPEAMLLMRESEEDDNFEKYSAIGIGPGLGTSIEAEELLLQILMRYEKPMVIDADAINIIAANHKLLELVARDSILTPHPKEFDRLFGHHETVEARALTAVKKAKEHGVVIVLKGHRTLVTYAGTSYVNYTGNAGLAKGGSGDALTGIITAFMAQGYKPYYAAKLGVYLHGLAADITLQNQSMESMLITDVIDNMGKVFNDVLS